MLLILRLCSLIRFEIFVLLNSFNVADLSGPPKPDGNTTAPPSVHVPTTAAPEPPLLNVTVQLPVTAQPPVANVTIPPVVEATTSLINTDNVTERPDNRPPLHPGTVLILQQHSHTPGLGTSIIHFFHIQFFVISRTTASVI